MRHEWYGTPSLGALTCQRCQHKKAKIYLRGVEDPADGVVNSFRLGEGLMATLMSDNPNACGEQTCQEAV